MTDLDKQIEAVEIAIFDEKMSDFINWERYAKLKNKLADLERQRDERTD